MHLKLLTLLALVGCSVASKSFSKYQFDFGKKYKSGLEWAERRAIFEANLNAINEHNEKFHKGEVSYKMGVNQFTDLTQAEFDALIQGLPALPKEQMKNSKATDESLKKLREKYANYNFKDSFSWVDEGVVTSVKDQGQCGSCTAFACTGAVESCCAIKSGQVFDDMAEQYLVDCAYGYDHEGFDAAGCSGAWPQAYFGYLADVSPNGNHQKESAYHYTAMDGSCKATDGGFYDQCSVTGQISYWGTDEDDLKALLVEHGPVVTGLNASPLSSYYGGVFDSYRCCDASTGGDSCTNKNNHAVLVVGYGSEGGKDYWLVKNSWGKYFGEDGFFKIKRGTGHCGFGWQLNSVPTC